MSQHAYADNFIMIVCYGGHQLQHDLTLSPSVRGVACETRKSKWNSNVCLLTLVLRYCNGCFSINAKFLERKTKCIQVIGRCNRMEVCGKVLQSDTLLSCACVCAYASQRDSCTQDATFKLFLPNKSTHFLPNKGAFCA